MFIVAACRESDGLMGLRNALPWPRLVKDLQHFKRLTLDSTVIMGRKTFESMGNKPLPQRRENLVLSSQGEIKSLDQALSMASKEKIAVIGGVVPFQQALAHKDCEQVYLTLIEFPEKAQVKLDETAVYFPLEQLRLSFEEKPFGLGKHIEYESGFTLKFTMWQRKEV